MLKFHIRHLLLSPLSKIYKTLNILDHEQQRTRVHNSWISTLKTTQKTQTEISLLVFICWEVKGQQDFYQLAAARLVLSSGLFCFLAGSNMVHFPLSFPGVEWALVVCIFKLFFTSGKFSLILPCLLLLLHLMLIIPWRHLQSSVPCLPYLYCSL